jgi:hypothetical protein
MAWRFRLTLLAALFSFTVCLFEVSGRLQAQEEQRNAQQDGDQVESGEETLFNGKSLEGWTVPVFGGDGTVDVVDGEIVLGVGDPLTGVTLDQKELPTRDYEISLEAKRLEGNDFFCCLTFPVDETFCSFVVGGWAGSVVGISNIDHANASENETRSLHKFETGKWYRIRVRVNQGRIQAWIDDEQVVDVKVTAEQLSLHNAVSLNRPMGISSFQTKAAIRNVILRKHIDEDGNTIEQHGK